LGERVLESRDKEFRFVREPAISDDATAEVLILLAVWQFTIF
jgi:hypothetical protein